MGVKHAKPPVHLHIEELVLHGFSPGDRLAIGDAVERELARIIAEPGWRGFPDRSLALERIDAGSFPVARGARAPAVGTSIARAVQGGLERSRRSGAPARGRGQGHRG